MGKRPYFYSYFYLFLLGPADSENKGFIERILTNVQKEFGYDRYLCKTYKAKIKMLGKRKEVSNYMVLLRSQDIKRYYEKEFQEAFITAKEK